MEHGTWEWETEIGVMMVVPVEGAAVIAMILGEEKREEQE